MQWTQSRRRFLATMSSAGAAGLISAPDALAQQAPETTTIRLARNPSLCIAPQYLVEEFLRMEGFTDVRYVMSDAAC
jgi:NitT/TauT family transport system substrate-binding protein